MDVSLCIDTFPLRVSMCARGCKCLSVLVAIHSLYLAVQQCESATQEFRPLVNTFIFDNFELTLKCKTLLCKYQFKPHSSTSDMLLSCHSDCDPQLKYVHFLYSCVYSGLLSVFWCAYICAWGDSPSKTFEKEVQLPSAQELKIIMLHVLCSYVCHVVLFINIWGRKWRVFQGQLATLLLTPILTVDRWMLYLSFIPLNHYTDSVWRCKSLDHF